MEWKHLELLYSSHSVLCSFVCRLSVVCSISSFWNIPYCANRHGTHATHFWVVTLSLFSTVLGLVRRFYFEDASIVFRPRHAGEIWKRCFHSENLWSSNVFRPHYTGEIWKRNSQLPFWICVWGKLGQQNHVIIVTSSALFWKCFPATLKRKVFPKGPFTWRITGRFNFIYSTLIMHGKITRSE